LWPSDTHGYATPATPNAHWSQPTLCGYQNQPCVPSGYQSGYLLPYPTLKSPKPRFWHFEPWFPKVLEISENTLLYITVGFFGSGGLGEGKVFISAFGAVGEGCDSIVIPTLRTAAMLCGNGLYTETVVVQPPSQTDTGRSLLHRPLPPPPPKTPVRLTDRRSELIYKIVMFINIQYIIQSLYKLLKIKMMYKSASKSGTIWKPIHIFQFEKFVIMFFENNLLH